MDLYLVRHAIAEPHDSARWPDDAARPLTAEGAERFRIVARGLRRLGVEVEVVLSSTFARAWRTAELLAEDATWPAPEEFRALEPPTPANECLQAMQAREESTLALVGHEPQLSWLASLLLAGSDRSLQLELKKGAVMCLRLDGVPAAGAASLRWSASPKVLRAVGAADS